MTILAENVIVAGADNRPPMFEKSMYDSWKIRMKLYIRGKEHRKDLIDSVLNGPFQYGTVVENGITRPKTYEELTDKEKIREEYDIRATNIVLQGLPPDVYNLVNHHIVAKEIWDRVKFTSKKGKTIHTYYLRFAQLMNDMNTIGMSMHKLQVNTKFMNNLPLEWSKFITDVKLARDMHESNFDQLYDYVFIDEMSTQVAKSRLQGKDTTISHLKKHIANLKEKAVADCSESVNNSRVIAPGMYKIDLQPLSSNHKKNKEVHEDYLKVTKEHADTLLGIVEQARALEPSDNALDYACNYAQRI
ncbi:hypothetical protein Tco_0776091 [Tanacetum coccineum]